MKLSTELTAIFPAVSTADGSEEEAERSSAKRRRLDIGNECDPGKVQVDNKIKFTCFTDTDKGVWGMKPVACVPSEGAGATEYKPGQKWDDNNFKYTCQLSDDSMTLSLDVTDCLSPTHEEIEIGQSVTVPDKGIYTCIQTEKGVTRKYAPGCVVDDVLYRPGQTWLSGNSSLTCYQESKGSYKAKASGCKASANAWVDVDALTIINHKYYKCQFDSENQMMGKLVEVDAKEYEDWWSSSGGDDEISQSGSSGTGNQQQHATTSHSDQDDDAVGDADAIPAQANAYETTGDGTDAVLPDDEQPIVINPETGPPSDDNEASESVDGEGADGAQEIVPEGSEAPAVPVEGEAGVEPGKEQEVVEYTPTETSDAGNPAADNENLSNGESLGDSDDLSDGESPAGQDAPGAEEATVDEDAQTADESQGDVDNPLVGEIPTEEGVRPEEEASENENEQIPEADDDEASEPMDEEGTDGIQTIVPEESEAPAVPVEAETGVEPAEEQQVVEYTPTETSDAGNPAADNENLSNGESLGDSDNLSGGETPAEEALVDDEAPPAEAVTAEEESPAAQEEPAKEPLAEEDATVDGNPQVDSDDPAGARTPAEGESQSDGDAVEDEMSPSENEPAQENLAENSQEQPESDGEAPSGPAEGVATAITDDDDPANENPQITSADDDEASESVDGERIDGTQEIVPDEPEAPPVPVEAETGVEPAEEQDLVEYTPTDEETSDAGDPAAGNVNPSDGESPAEGVRPAEEETENENPQIPAADDDSVANGEPLGDSDNPSGGESPAVEGAPAAEEALADERTPPAEAVTAEEESPPAEEALTDEAPTDEAPTDEAPTDEALTDEAPTDEAPTDEAPTDEAPTDEAPTDEAPTDEAPTDEAPTDEAPTDEAPTDEAPTDEALTDEAPTDEAPIDETLVEEPAAEEPAAEENATVDPQEDVDDSAGARTPAEGEPQSDGDVVEDGMSPSENEPAQENLAENSQEQQEPDREVPPSGPTEGVATASTDDDDGDSAAADATPVSETGNDPSVEQDPTASLDAEDESSLSETQDDLPATSATAGACEDAHSSCTMLCNSLCDVDLQKEEPVGLAIRKRDVAYVSWREYNMAYFSSHEKNGKRPGAPATKKECNKLASAGHAMVRALCPKSCGACDEKIDQRQLIQQYMTAECHGAVSRMN